MKNIALAALTVAFAGASTSVSAAPASQLLVLSQSSAQVDYDKIPTCSKSVTSNCKKRRSNGAWYIVGAAGVAGAIALAANGNGHSASP